MEPSCCHHLNLFLCSPPALLTSAVWWLGKPHDGSAEDSGHSLFENKLLWLLNLFRVPCTLRNARAISTARLNTSPCLHLRPIDVVVCDGPQVRSNLGAGFVLRCFQHLSFPDAATRPCPSAGQPAYRRSVRHGPLVLVPGPLKSQRPQQIETELSHDVLNPARVPL